MRRSPFVKDQYIFDLLLNRSPEKMLSGVLVLYKWKHQDYKPWGITLNMTDINVNVV